MNLLITVFKNETIKFLLSKDDNIGRQIRKIGINNRLDLLKNIVSSH